MRRKIFSEVTGQLLFELYDSSKEKKTNRFRIHHHTNTELDYVLKGSGIYHIAENQYDACTGDTFLIRSNEQHCMPTVKTLELKLINLRITPYYFWRICPDYIPLKALRMLMHGSGITKIYHGLGIRFEFLNALLYQEDNAENNAKIRREVLKIIIEICDRIADEQEKLPTANISKNYNVFSKFEEIQETLAYMDAHYMETITLAELAAYAKLSRSSFSICFKAFTGMSPIEYLIVRRVESAVYRLGSTMDNVSDIALECGFSNLSNFNRLFKKVTGITPKEYRSRYLNI